MTSNPPENHQDLPVLRPFPRQSRRRNPFWPQPVTPGFYGRFWSATGVVTSNYAPEISRWQAIGAQLGSVVLAIDTGGLSPGAAAAFGYIRESDLEAAINLFAELSPISQIIIPSTIASIIGWQADDQIGRLTFIVADNKAQLRSSGETTGKSKQRISTKYFRALFQRLGVGLGLWVGQAMIFILPLLIFGWQALVYGLSALFAGAFGLLILWPVTPGAGAVKGIIVGGVFMIIQVLLYLFIFQLPLLQVISPACGIWLGTAWMGFVFSGLKIQH